MNDRVLVLLRHGKSDWSGDEADHDRALAPRGMRQAPEAGRWLRTRLPPFDAAVVSPARRAVDTWELVGTQLHVVPPTTYDERVYGAGGEELLAVVHELPDYAAAVVVVGHNPGLEDLVSLLTGVWVPMPTSAMAVIDLTGPWTEAGTATGGARGTLRTSGRPPT